VSLDHLELEAEVPVERTNREGSLEEIVMWLGAARVQREHDRDISRRFEGLGFTAPARSVPRRSAFSTARFALRAQLLRPLFGWRGAGIAVPASPSVAC